MRQFLPAPRVTKRGRAADQLSLCRTRERALLTVGIRRLLRGERRAVLLNPLARHSVLRRGRSGGSSRFRLLERVAAQEPPQLAPQLDIVASQFLQQTLVGNSAQARINITLGSSDEGGVLSMLTMLKPQKSLPR